jgi:hypothetical protein
VNAHNGLGGVRDHVMKDVRASAALSSSISSTSPMVTSSIELKSKDPRARMQWMSPSAVSIMKMNALTNIGFKSSTSLKPSHLQSNPCTPQHHNPSQSQTQSSGASTDITIHASSGNIISSGSHGNESESIESIPAHLSGMNDSSSLSFSSTSSSSASSSTKPTSSDASRIIAKGSILRHAIANDEMSDNPHVNDIKNERSSGNVDQGNDVDYRNTDHAQSDENSSRKRIKIEDENDTFNQQKQDNDINIHAAIDKSMTINVSNSNPSFGSITSPTVSSNRSLISERNVQSRKKFKKYIQQVLSAIQNKFSYRALCKRIAFQGKISVSLQEAIQYSLVPRSDCIRNHVFIPGLKPYIISSSSSSSSASSSSTSSASNSSLITGSKANAIAQSDKLKNSFMPLRQYHNRSSVLTYIGYIQVDKIHQQMLELQRQGQNANMEAESSTSNQCSQMRNNSILQSKQYLSLSSNVNVIHDEVNRVYKLVDSNRNQKLCCYEGFTYLDGTQNATQHCQFQRYLYCSEFIYSCFVIINSSNNCIFT